MPAAPVFNSYLQPGIRGKIGSCNYLNEWQQRQESLVPSDIMFSLRGVLLRAVPSLSFLSPTFSLLYFTLFLSLFISLSLSLSLPCYLPPAVLSRDLFPALRPFPSPLHCGELFD